MCECPPNDKHKPKPLNSNWSSYERIAAPMVGTGKKSTFSVMMATAGPVSAALALTACVSTCEVQRLSVY